MIGYDLLQEKVEVTKPLIVAELKKKLQEKPYDTLIPTAGNRMVIRNLLDFQMIINSVFVKHNLKANIIKFNYKNTNGVLRFALNVMSFTYQRYYRVFKYTVKDFSFEDFICKLVECNYELLYLTCAYSNVTSLNNLLAELCEEANTDYKVQMRLDITLNKTDFKLSQTFDKDCDMLSILTQNLIVFNVNINTALHINDTFLLSDNVFVGDSAKKQLLQDLRNSYNPVELLNSNSVILQDYVKGSMRRRPDLIIKDSFRFTLQSLLHRPVGIGYYIFEVDEYKYITLIEKTISGEYKFLLPPLNIKTLQFDDVSTTEISELIGATA